MKVIICIALLSLTGCDNKYNKGYRLVRCEIENTTKCQMFPWPLTKYRCNVKVTQAEKYNYIYACERVSP